MEVWNLYNKHGEKLDKTIVRGQCIPKGMYHLVVHIIIKNSNEEYLIQKRSDTKESAPGIWAFTAGSAIINENSEEAALRELSEETGIHLSKGDLLFDSRIVRDKFFQDFWHARVDVDETTLVFQEEEVSALDFKTKTQIEQMIEDNIFHCYDEEYLNTVFNI